MAKIINIVGNGSSSRLFKHMGLFTVACNIPPKNIQYNTLSIIDNQPILWMKTNSWQPRVPVLCTESVKNMAQSKGRTGDWRAVYEKTSRWNSGHHAVKYFCETQSVDQIHLWGFDSVYTEDLTSVQDSVIIRHRRPNLNQHWRPIWNTLFDSFPNTEMIFHTNTRINSAYEQANVKFKSHT